MSAAPEISRIDWLAEYPPPRSLPLDQEALRIYEHAYYIGLKTEKNDDPPVSFTSVMIALLVGEDETSQWFARLAIEHGPKAASVFSEKSVAEQTVRDLERPVGKPSQTRLSNDKQLLTVSARAVIENAEGWAHSVGGSDIRGSASGGFLRSQSTASSPRTDARMGVSRIEMAFGFLRLGSGTIHC